MGIASENVLFIEQYKTDSTKRQYEASWKRWVSFIKQLNPPAITPDVCISFFKSLHDDEMAATTITSYKSALRRPILKGFGIDLGDDLFSKIPKACARLRPAKPPKPVSWSLAVVLQHASQIDNASATPKQLLEKTIFLAMASGARLSELAALSRDPDHVSFQESGEVLLSPLSTFLAK